MLFKRGIEKNGPTKIHSLITSASLLTFVPTRERYMFFRANCWTLTNGTVKSLKLKVRRAKFINKSIGCPTATPVVTAPGFS